MRAKLSGDFADIQVWNRIRPDHIGVVFLVVFGHGLVGMARNCLPICEFTPLLALFRAAFGTNPVLYFSSFLSVFACQIPLPHALFPGDWGDFPHPLRGAKPR